jgi:hypothetical protein
VRASRPCPLRALQGSHPRSFTANHGQPKLLFSSSVLRMSCSSQAHDQTQMPPAGLGSGMAQAGPRKWWVTRRRGYPVASTPPRPRSEASSPTRWDTRSVPQILRQKRPPNDHLQPLLTSNNRKRPVPARTVEKCLRWPDEPFGHDWNCPVAGTGNR